MAIEDQIDTLIAQVGELVDATTVKKQYFDTVIANATAAVGDVDARLSSASTLVSDAQAAATSAQETAAALGDLDAALASATNDADRAELAATAAQSVVTQDLSAIDAQISGAAFDVFIYDTTKDSDGGAWRKRCQHTSWYNEPLNTATRGSRREFPAVAVIVAEASRVVIYDGDDPALPMWMTFSLNNQDRVSIAAQNGIVLLGNKWTANAVFGGNGLNILDFVADRWRLSLRNGSVPWLAPEMPYIKSGDMTTWFATRTHGPRQFFSLVDYTVNDVAMTVLPDAPIDPATGLPVPTIAVATQGGVSVIKHDGTVVTKSYGIAACRSVDFDEETVLVCGVGPDAYHNQWTWDLDTGTVREYGGYAISVPHLLGNIQDTKVKRTGLHRSAWHSASKLALLVENRDEQSRGMVAYTAANYATGWLVGDTKGALLASTDATALTGEELVTNGDFATGDLTGWSATNAIYDAGSLRCADGSFSQSVFSGARAVRVSWTQTVHAGTRSRLRLRNAADSANVGPFSYFTGSGDHSILVDTSAGLSIRFYVESGNDVSFDNISVSPVDADRSAYGNGLIVNGTLTRKPVADGAELVAYSGFSDTSFLEGADGSDFDFGTADFTLMAWAKTTSGASQVIMSFGNADGTGNAWQFKKDSNPDAFGFRFTVDDGATTREHEATTTINTSGAFHFATVVREGKFLRIYTDGVLEFEREFDGVLDFSNPDGKIRVGVNSVKTGGWLNGDLVLVRASEGAASANQIRKTYEDERELFKAGAACTLKGSDNLITGMAYDDATDLLHVGTSEGRSVFKGLRRIDQTDTPVTTAIAASGGMIVEA